MELLIVMSIVFATIEIISAIKYIKKKDYICLIAVAFQVIFLVFLFSSGFLGGSAYNNAASKYELYQEGHYYLVSHNIYTEVSRNAYIYMKIMEPIGIVSFAISFVIAICKERKEKRKAASVVKKVKF